MSTEPNDIDDFFSTARVSSRTEAIELPTDDFDAYLYDHGDSVLAGGRGMNYEEFAEDRYSAPFLRELLDYWDELYREPFVGITSDGIVREGVYVLPPDAEVDDPALVDAAQNLIAALTPGQRDQLCYPLDAPEWRAWSNPEFMVYRVGLRMEILTTDKVDAIFDVIRACVSPVGYARIRRAMELNGFLGRVVDLPSVMNDRSYWFSVFGTPEAGGAWGWQLFGHHVALNFVSVAGRHVIAPVFLGAEPASSDEDRSRLFADREQLAITLAESFTPTQRAEAIVFTSVLDPAMPEGRLHPADERHVAGAFRDNRVVPYEGLRVDSFTEEQNQLLRSIVEDFFALLVEAQRERTMAEYDAHLDDTWFSWYGATDGSQPFYFRVQSPVILAELDHHAGVWLNNRLPARFHVHTTLRLPNGNDYGKAYIAQL